VSPSFLQPEEIASILKTRHLIAENDKVRLLPDENGDMRIGIAPGIWFKIGSDLNALVDHARQFHQACPEIAVKPLFFFEEGGWQWFGCEHEKSSQPLRDDQLAHAIQVIEKTFASTGQPSTVAAAEAEIDAFLASLCQLPEFTLLDRELLTRYVGNELKATLVQSQPHIRWAHGNLTAEVIRVHPGGRVLLQEPEFAARTHFYAEDWLRLNSALGRSNYHRRALWAYFHLREILIDRTSLQTNLARAVSLLDASGRAISQSLLARTAANMIPPIQPSHNGRVQLFASQSEAFSEEGAVTIELCRIGWQCACLALPLTAGSWNLRLDPATEPGLIEISRISVHSASEGELFSSNQPAKILTASGTGVAIQTDAAFRILSYGNDPQVLLPRIRTNADGEVAVEVWMQWKNAETALAEIGPDFAKEAAQG
jgi:hypothetical protein